MSSPQTPEFIVSMVSQRLRELVHDLNNSIFITKGFIEELSEDITAKRYRESNFDDENFIDMIQTVNRTVEKIDQNLSQLRKFAKEEIFDKSGLPRENKK
jgi:galactokinase/mevalonate kinase-like predicted kinase